MTILYRALNRLKNNFQRFFSHKIIVFETFQLDYIDGSGSDSVGCAKSLSELEGLTVNPDLREVASERMEKGNILYYIESQDAIVAWGWYAPQVTSFYIYEIDSSLYFKQPTNIMYDFYTMPDFRNHGAYKTLIVTMSQRDDKRKIIFAKTQNRPSLRAINHVGFKPLGIYSHFQSKHNQPL